MNLENIKTLVHSQNVQDRILAMEILTTLEKKDLFKILTESKFNNWRAIPYQNDIGGSPINGIMVKCGDGYLAYNGRIWYCENVDLLRNSGYKKEEHGL